MNPRQISSRLNVAVAVILALLISSHPASPQEGSEPGDRKAQDERLKQSVTSRSVDQPLRTWLERLGQETGVRLKIAPDYEDRALTVRVKAMPLGELMEAVASLYGDHWRRGRKNEDADYVLEASLARRSRQRRILQTYQRVLLTDLIHQANVIARPNEVPLEALPHPERTLRLDEYQLKARGRVVSLLGPEMVTRLLSGETIALRVADATGALGEALRELVVTYAMPAPDGWTAQDQETAWVVLSSESYQYRPREGIESGFPHTLIRMGIGPHGAAVRGTSVKVADHRVFERLTKELAPLQDEKPDPRERQREGAAFLQRTLPADTKPEDGPLAQRSEMLSLIADAADVNLIADSHTKPRRLTPGLGGRSVEEALAAVCDLWQSDWRVKHATILVRSRHWWADDAAEPPATAAAGWQERFQAQGVLDLEDAARIAALSYEQQQRLALRIPEARAAFHPWLRFFASLGTAQKEALRSPQGLDLRTVPAPERLLLMTANFMRVRPGNTTGAETVASGQAVVRLSEETRQGRPVVVFVYAPLGATRQAASSTSVWLPYRARSSSGDERARGGQ